MLGISAAAVVTAEATGMLRDFPENPLGDDSKRTSAITNAKGTLVIVPFSLTAWILGMTAVQNLSLQIYAFASLSNLVLTLALLLFHTAGNDSARAFLERVLSITISFHFCNKFVLAESF